jgi:hypothetical protein
LGAASDSFLQRRDQQLAWPTYHRLPDEVVDEVPSEQGPGDRRREGRVFHNETVGGIAVAGAPGGDKDEARARAGLDKVKDQLS